VPSRGSAPAFSSVEPVQRVRVLALNAAKCGFHRGGLEFASRADVRATLERIASAIHAQAPDLVFLSEVVMESAPHGLDQVAELARACDLPHWAAGENDRFGLPGWRIRSGNALLSRFELRALEVVQLAGARPFWNPTGNRRALLFEFRIGARWLLGASIRNDSVDPANKAAQTEQLFARLGDRPALVTGDFGAKPGRGAMDRWLASGKFSGYAPEPPTFRAWAPSRRIDHVLAPAEWTLLEQSVLDTRASDHLAVVASFALPGNERAPHPGCGRGASSLRARDACRGSAPRRVRQRSVGAQSALVPMPVDGRTRPRCLLTVGAAGAAAPAPFGKPCDCASSWARHPSSRIWRERKFSPTAKPWRSASASTSTIACALFDWTARYASVWSSAARVLSRSFESAISRALASVRSFSSCATRSSTTTCGSACGTAVAELGTARARIPSKSAGTRAMRCACFIEGCIGAGRPAG
jgi:endonuclease/exonuclease/phosphatase family metal-dependent hydrolase